MIDPKHWARLLAYLDAPAQTEAEKVVLELMGTLDPLAALERALSTLPPLTLAAIRHDWRGFWARPKQILPIDAGYRSVGLLPGRGFGKSRTMHELLVHEVLENRCARFAVMAQNEDEAWNVIVNGRSGLIACSPPNAKWRIEKGTIVCPNGTTGRVFSPHEPDNIRGDDVDIFLTSELAAWPRTTMDHAFYNVGMMCRKGRGLHLWDTTPKKAHPLVRKLLARAVADPERHLVVRGSGLENLRNLSPVAIEEWVNLLDTQWGRQEVDGEFFDSAEGALFKAEWVARARRPMPTAFKRRIIAMDCALSTHRGSDDTGIIELGLGTDGQVYVIRDLSGRYRPSEWAKIALDAWAEGRCDCIVLERSAGDTLTEILRGAARERSWTVPEPLQRDAPTRHVPGTVYVKELPARRGKAVRAEGTATSYELGRVSHVIGADLEDLEQEMFTYEGSPEEPSPDRLDALVHGVRELGLGDPGPDYRKGFEGLSDAAKRVAQPPPAPERPIQDPLALLQRGNPWTGRGGLGL